LLLFAYLISINRFSKDLARVFGLQKIKGFPENNVEWLQLQVHDMLFHLHLIGQEETKCKVEINILLKEMKVKEQLAMINGGRRRERQASTGNS